MRCSELLGLETDPEMDGKEQVNEVYVENMGEYFLK